MSISKQGIEQTRPELSTHDTALTALQTDVGDPSARTNLQTLIAMLGNPDASGKSLYDNLGDFKGRTNDQSLLEVIGIPDTDGKDLHTLLVTDRLDHATFGLSQIRDDVAAIPTTVLVATGVGVAQIKATTIDLNQVAATYDLLTGTSQVVILESLNIKMPTEAASAPLTSISIQTDDVTNQVIINSTDGDVSNLTSEAELAWTGSIYITVATKIRLTIAGGAHGSAYVCQVTAKCRAVIAGGNLA